MTDTDLQALIDRGEQAEVVLNHPLFHQAFEDLQADIIRQWEISPGRDTVGRENAYIAIQLLKSLRAQFERHIRTGKHASRKLLNTKTTRLRSMT